MIKYKTVKRRSLQKKKNPLPEVPAQVTTILSLPSGNCHWAATVGGKFISNIGTIVLCKIGVKVCVLTAT